LLFALAAGATACAVLVVVTARVLTGQAGFTESGLERRIVEQQRQAEQLELEVAQLRAPQRVYQRAAELGLVQPDRTIFLTPGAELPSPSPKAAARQARPTKSSSPSPERGER
jgi:hypothetical protein